MKILCIGDAHGKTFPGLKKIIKKEKIDCVLCTGDIPNTDYLRHYIFKYWDVPLSLSEILGEKKFNQIMLKTLKSKNRVIKELDSMNTPVFLVGGNSDFFKIDLKEPSLKKYAIEEYVKKTNNIKLLKHDKKTMNNTEIVGITGYGLNKKSVKHKKNKAGKKDRFYENLKKAEKLINKNSIVLGHDAPYMHFDLVKNSESPMHGYHVGEKAILKMIKNKKPAFYIFGHMHEYFAKKKIGKTILLACGVGNKGDYWLINTDDKTVRRRSGK